MARKCSESILTAPETAWGYTQTYTLSVMTVQNAYFHQLFPDR